MAEPLLAIDNLRGWYGASQALHGMSLHVNEGETVTLLGRNGAGKTSTLRALMGLLPRVSGSIRLDGTEIIHQPPEKIARRGIAYCPEERAIFAGLSVQENLMLPPVIAGGGMGLTEIEKLFPNLAGRSASSGTKLSGGEQQMLAIARILRTGARLLLLDEPTEGLAPVIIRQIANVIENLKTQGYTIILVEQNARFAARVADRYYIVSDGAVSAEITRAELAGNPALLDAYMAL